MNNIANINWKSFEKLVKELIEKKDYIFLEKKKYLTSKDILEKKVYSRQVMVGKTIYDTKRKCDFITYNPFTQKETIIECKWQHGSGSVDEKYPFLVLNIEKSKIDTIIVLDGGGYREGAEKWLKSQVGGGYLIDVLNLGEFSKKIRTKNLI